MSSAYEAEVEAKCGKQHLSVGIGMALATRHGHVGGGRYRWAPSGLGNWE